MKRSYAKLAAAAVVALAIPASGAFAQTTTPQTGQATTLGQPTGNTAVPGAAPGIADPSSSLAGKVTTLGEATTAASFAQMAASSGIFEVESSRLAMDKSRHDQVRTFANHMVQDHTLSNQQLMTLSRAHGIEPRPILTGQQQQMMTQMQGLSGADFDRQYLTNQVLAHQETIRLYEAARTSSDPGMQPFRDFAAQSLPTLEQHLRQAQALAGAGTPTAQQ